MSSIPAQFVQLIDDAAIFPPRSAPLAEALERYRVRSTAEGADLVGSFVIGDQRLPELIELLAEDSPLPVSVVVSGGVGAIEGAVRWAARAAALDLHAVEFALRDEDDLAHNARRAIAMLDNLEAEFDGVSMYVEMPRLAGEPSYGWSAAVEELATREIPLKFRTGWLDPVAAPTPGELAACIDTALDHELAFKCTAGLHSAVTHDGAHGFLNVLAATVASLEGTDVEGALRETDVGRLAEIATTWGERGRRWFRSFGCCAVEEARDDLAGSGLL